MACGLPPAPYCHHINKSRDWREEASVPPRRKGLMLLLLFSLRSFQRPAAFSSDVLTCVDLSVYLMTEGNNDFDQSCCKSLVCALLRDTCLQSHPPCFSHFLSLLDWVCLFLSPEGKNVTIVMFLLMSLCACSFLSVSLAKCAKKANGWIWIIRLESIMIKMANKATWPNLS